MTQKPIDILKKVSSIAIVGISKNAEKESYAVMRFLIESGFEVYPVNPNYNNEFILGRKCSACLKDIDENIDMVDIFRKKEFVYNITKEAIDINAKVLWTQLDIICIDSMNLATNAGLDVVMNKCPKIELINNL
jgi:predicted CoA-binding protein